MLQVRNRRHSIITSRLCHYGGNTRGVGVVLNNLGFYSLERGEPQKGIDFFNQALVILHDAGFRRGEARVLSNLGRAYERLGNLTEALDRYQKSIAVYESVRTDVTLEEIKTGLGD